MTLIAILICVCCVAFLFFVGSVAHYFFISVNNDEDENEDTKKARNVKIIEILSKKDGNDSN